MKNQHVQKHMTINTETHKKLTKKQETFYKKALEIYTCKRYN